MVRRVGLALGLVLLASGCIDKADAQKTDAAMTAFFTQVQAKQYGVIYDAAAPEFRASMTKDVFVGMMQRIDRKLGDCQPPVKRLDYHFNASTEGFFATQGFTSTCANGKLDESVTTVVRNGQASLAGYYAKSPLLLTD